MHAADVIALCDFSPASTNAAWRAALAARDRGARLRLLHVQPRPDPADAQAALQLLATELHARTGIAVIPCALAGEPLQEVVRAARDASLLVLGPPRGNPLRTFILGTQAERLLRLCRVPVLVVKRPAMGSYRRVLVPVDLGPGSGQVIATASLFSRDPRMEVLHALGHREEAAPAVAEVPEPVLRGQRNRAADLATGRLQVSIAQAGAAAQDARPAVTFGDAAASVIARERAMRADLVVLGKRRRGLLADFFLGSVTQRVLAGARADVLAVPVSGEPPPAQRAGSAGCVQPGASACGSAGA